MERILKKAASAENAALRLLKKHWRQVLYYGCVMTVLGVVAYAAEVYRTNPDNVEMVLPAAEISVPDDDEEEIQPLLPADARLIRSYSSRPAWNEALCQWEIHEGTDYAFDGAIVAFCDGTVSKITSDHHSGNHVEVDCGEYLLRYCGITPNDGLSEGAIIRAGEEIGSADSSIPSEQFMGPHLHLEVYRNGELIDPESTLRENAKKVSNS